MELFFLYKEIGVIRVELESFFKKDFVGDIFIFFDIFKIIICLYINVFSIIFNQDSINSE
jgi:hypothetical protein